MRSLLNCLGLVPGDVAAVNAIASRTYRPGKFNGKVHLFRAMDEVGSKYDERLAAWQRTAGELVVHDIPGVHGTIMDENHVTTLAQKLKASLDEAQASIVGA
jgi:thioesterase domain-containing protein